LTFIGAGSIRMIHDFYNSRWGWQSEEIATAPHYVKAWAMWDSSFYTQIAHEGYPETFDPTVINAYGFLPGYSLVIGYISKFLLFKHTILAGFIVSNISLILAAFFFFRLVEEDYGSDKAQTALYLLIFQPFGFLFSAVMSEGFFLLLSVLTIWYMRKNKLGYAALLGTYAAITRPVGILLLIPIFILLIKNKVPWPKFILQMSLFIASFGAGIMAVFMYFYIRSGDFFAYFHSQSGAWKHHFSNPLQETYIGLHSAVHFQYSAYFLIAYTIILLISSRKLKIEYTAYAWPVLFLHTFSGTILSTPRYGAVVFPMAIGGALLLRNEQQRVLTYTLLALLQGACMVAWANGIHFSV
jgi:hypothetical protein